MRGKEQRKGQRKEQRKEQRTVRCNVPAGGW